MGKQSGKLGQSVLSTRYGEQIQRAYVKEIANPKTVAQVATRSRFKLASQLSAAMADVIAIPRVGSKTGRNQFVSATMNITQELDGVAMVSLNDVQLTKSQRGLIGFEATRDTTHDKISIALKGANGTALSRVVYVAFEKQNDGSLVQLDSKVISEAGESNTFPADLAGSTKSVVLYAYGIADKDSAASVKFGNLTAPTAEQVAKLITTSSEVQAGVNLTKTNGATMNVGSNSCDSDDVTPILPVTFANMKVNSNNWNANLTGIAPSSTNFTGRIGNIPAGMKVAIFNEDINVPVVGSDYPIVGSAVDADASTGDFTLTATLPQERNIYLAVGSVADNRVTATAIYQYRVETMGGD